MFQFITDIFKKENPKELIEILQNEHQILVEIYTKITNHVDNDEFEKVESEIKNFVEVYNNHISLEDNKLYVALEEKYKNQPKMLETIKEIEVNMNSITKAIKFFEEKHTSISKNTKDIFIDEFKHIGSILSARVELEEKRLYPLL